jgi:hypothetical protein
MVDGALEVTFEEPAPEPGVADSQLV